MSFGLISLVLFLQILTVYLDNKTNMHDFFFRVQQGTIATAYTNRGITLTVSRTLFYAVPPLLGYLILNSTRQQIEFLIILTALINFLITFFQGHFYCKVFKKKLIAEILEIKPMYSNGEFYIGILAFMFFLMTPYLLNYLALIYSSQGLWIVQLNAVFNSFLTLYVIWIFEPRVAKKIDKKNNYENEFFEAIFVRLYGRILIFIIILFNFYI